MVFLRFVIIFIVFASLGRAIEEVEDFKLVCSYENDCARYKDDLNRIIGKGISHKKFKDGIRHLLFDKTLRNLEYSINDDSSLISVKIAQNQLISSILFSSDIDVDFENLRRSLSVQEGNVFRSERVASSKKIIVNYLDERGYGNARIQIETSEDDNRIELLIKVVGGKPIILKTVNVQVTNGENVEEEIIQNGFRRFAGKVWDEVRFGVFIEDLKRDLLSRGYVQSEVSYDKKQNRNTKSVVTTVRVNLGEKRHFYFSGNNMFTRQELVEAISIRVKSVLGNFSVAELKKTIRASYEAHGVYGSIVRVRKATGRTLQGIRFSNYYFDIIEGEKVQIEQIHYRGNMLIKDGVLGEIYEEKASVLASRGYLDQKYVKKFTKVLRNEYLKKGFIFVDVELPKVSITNNGAVVVYEIREGQECRVREVKFSNVPEELNLKLQNVMKNQVGRSFDSQVLGEDLKNVIIRAKNEGYYFAEIANEDKSSIVKFTSDYSEVTIDVDLRLDKRTILGQVIVSGNVSTRDTVIEREVYIEKGELLPYEDVVAIQRHLVGLGLFSSVEITPYVTNRESDDENFEVNLLIRVQEIKFRTVELAPGYRSDIGLKTSLGFNYNNWMGMNRSIGLRFQSNWRTNLDELDSKRKSDGKKMLEYSTKLKLSEPYFLGIGVGANLIFSVTRKRFYGYDADIRRVSSSLSKTMGKFSTSLTWRFENIHQFNASEDKDSGTFTIGGITPSVSLDLRDDKANPSKGIFIGLSSEFANPSFGSQKDAGLEVNFVRTILRNKIYFPIGKWITAISTSFGYEENLAGSSSYIPGIKVFRLSGVDTVRGFQDDEINRLSSGEDISEKTINGTAYFFVMKIEPRYRLSDSTQLGIFYDLGRIYANKFDLKDVRGAFGVSFKFLTPVGSLNFDYGIKQRRYSGSSGSKEGFGRFHLQIGHF